MLGRHLMVGLIVVVAAAGCSGTGGRPPAVADPATFRDVATGRVVGFQNEYGGHAWLGIPYAAPPVEKLRWRGPKPAVRWRGTLEALSFGSPCVQYASNIGGVPGKPGQVVGSEDCLFLNVFAPRLAADSLPSGSNRLPVMVWIHGGGNTIGQSGFYNGGNLASTQNVVVVSINYRLGPFGWYRHASLRSDDTSAAERSGNFGMLDIIAALGWVRDNIAAFGGNPDNVTIFGESAGGTDVYTMLLSPQARGLFHRAIPQSGGFYMNTPARAENFTDAESPGDANSSNEMLLRMVLRDKIAKDRDGARYYLTFVQAQDVARYLRTKTPAEILTAYEPNRTGMIQMPLVFADGTTLPVDDPLKQFATPGAYNQVPVLVGTNRDENKLFMFGDPDEVRRWFWIVPRLRDPRMYNLTAEYMAKMWKARGADEPAAAMRGVQGPSVFVYRFDWDEEPVLLGANLSEMLGAAHGFEIPFVFGHFDLGKEGNVIFTKENEAGRKQLSDQMMSYWAQFAATGAPGRGRDGKQPEWAAWDNSSPEAAKFLLLDTPAGGGLRMSNESITRAALLAGLAKDERFHAPVERCAVYYHLAQWSRGLTKDEYAQLAECQPYPFDKFPWK